MKKLIFITLMIFMTTNVFALNENEKTEIIDLFLQVNQSGNMNKIYPMCLKIDRNLELKKYLKKKEPYVYNLFKLREISIRLNQIQQDLGRIASEDIMLETALERDGGYESNRTFQPFVLNQHKIINRFIVRENPNQGRLPNQIRVQRRPNRTRLSNQERITRRR